ncbi:hypothetical protein QTO30_20110 [Yoonia sp. GPGPB17]|uniref:hypothetical protein n=1 Tax=Yoonia sp. GPGPB17 TaxID=3026147 RepID=UPI0030BC381E
MRPTDADLPYKPTTQHPPEGLDFWELFDFFWVRGFGNIQHDDGTWKPWTAASLETALDGSPDKRSIENWRSQANMPSPANLHKLSWIIAGEDRVARTAWYEALVAARMSEKRKEQAASKSAPEQHLVDLQNQQPKRYSFSPMVWAAGALALGGLAVGAWVAFSGASSPAVQNIRICDAPYFDDDKNDCTQHVSVFVEGVDEVFLSFDFEGVPNGTPFDRWWIHNGERVAGRTSFNDEAWPGYTFWRPGVLQVGQYVVRIVVDGEVFTQTFFVQPEGFTEDE